MGYAPTKAELEKLTDDEIVERYNAHASGTVVGSGFYLDELARRGLALENSRMAQMTKTMKDLTWAIFGLTVVNLVVVVYQTLK